MKKPTLDKESIEKCWIGLQKYSKDRYDVWCKDKEDGKVVLLGRSDLKHLKELGIDEKNIMKDYSLLK